MGPASRLALTVVSLISLCEAGADRHWQWRTVTPQRVGDRADGCRRRLLIATQCSEWQSGGFLIGSVAAQ